MKAFIVDDEQFARQSIITILNTRFTDISIVGEASSVKDAVEGIKKTKPDIVFLDIDLTDGSGFDVVNFLKPVNFKIIFITAHQEYAIKAIKFSALDYILKPISSIELEAAVNRVVEEASDGSERIKYEAIENNAHKSNKEKKIVLKTSESIHLIEVSQIVRCEADNNYTTFFMNDGQKIIISKGLKEYDGLLKEFGFYRIHQSHLINMAFISRFDKRDGGFVVLNDDIKLPVSQRKKQGLLDLFEKFSS